jgi:hypothetical protein
LHVLINTIRVVESQEISGLVCISEFLRCGTDIKAYVNSIGTGETAEPSLGIMRIDTFAVYREDKVASGVSGRVYSRVVAYTVSSLFYSISRGLTRSEKVAR